MGLLFFMERKTGLSCSLALNGVSDFLFNGFAVSKEKSFSLRSLALSWIIRVESKAWFCLNLRAGFASLTRRPIENPLEPGQSSALWFSSSHYAFYKNNIH